MITVNKPKQENLSDSNVNMRERIVNETKNMNTNKMSNNIQDNNNNSQGDDESEDEGPSPEELKKLIMFFELTRRNYINLFKTLISSNGELMGKVNFNMLKIIMAKELKIEEYLQSIDIDISTEAIDQYFLEPFCYEKKSNTMYYISNSNEDIR